MQRFSRERFEQAFEQRTLLCAELAAVLAGRLDQSKDFHRTVYALIAELKAVGHELTSYDESDDTQAWGPDYVKPPGPGLVLTFAAPHDVEVKWSTQ